MQKVFQLESGTEIFVMGITSPIRETNRGNDIVEAIKALLEIQTQVIICAPVDVKYEKIFQLFQKEHPKHFAVMEYSPENVRKTHAAADSELFVSYPENTEEVLDEALRYGVVPVSISHESLTNFNAVEETGNAFLISQISLWHVFETCIRAKENFKFPYDWKNIQQACMGGE
jgi:glycogen synthase